MNPCPERAKRDAMNEGEFWDYVLLGIEPGAQPEEYEPDADELHAIADLTPCPECGEYGPCAFDDQGRALIHVVPEEVDA